MTTRSDLRQSDRIIAALKDEIAQLKAENVELDPSLEYEPDEDEVAAAEAEAAAASAAVAAKRAAAMEVLGTNHAFIGCYTNKHGHIKGDQLGGGVYSFSINADGSMTQCGPPAPSEDPSFVCVSSGAKYLSV